MHVCGYQISHLCDRFYVHRRVAHQLVRLTKVDSSSVSSCSSVRPCHVARPSQLVFKLFRSPLRSSSSLARPQVHQIVLKLLSSSSSSSHHLTTISSPSCQLVRSSNSSSYQLTPRLQNSSTSSPSGSSSIDCIVHLSRRPALLNLQQNSVCPIRLSTTVHPARRTSAGSSPTIRPSSSNGLARLSRYELRVA
ncbi:hypothetical protein AtEden1_Chr1g0029781 [Arabidopsis thaliana]